MQHHDLVIITREAFPVGMAATNRMLTYAIELSRQFKVKVIVLRPTELPGRINNKHIVGKAGLVDFEYAANTTIWPVSSTKLVKLGVVLHGYWRAMRLLRQSQPKAVIYVSRDLFIPFFLKLLSFFLHFRIYREISEVIQGPKNFLQRILVVLGVRWTSGHIAMTHEINEQLKKLGNDNIFLLPMSVDISRFPVNFSRRREKYFFYCCGSTWERDGAIDFISAFDIFCQTRDDFELWMAGELQLGVPYHNKVKSLIENAAFSRHMKLLGRLAPDCIPSLLMNATAAVMSPSRDYDSGGFPTKLGEYLAAGVPVICTAVSEIPKYLTRSNSYIVAPGDVKALSKAMLEIVDHPDNAVNVAAAGRQTAERFFTVGNYAKDFASFLGLQ